MQKILQQKYWWALLLMCFALVLYCSSIAHAKLDLTKEQRFSISNATKQLLGNLDEKIEVHVLLTGNLSSGFKKLSIATEELLSNYRDVSNGKLTFAFKHPTEGLKDSILEEVLDSLKHYGVKTFKDELESEAGEKTLRTIYPAALVKYKGKVRVVDLMSGKSGLDEESTLNYSEALLEFKFDDAIDKLTKKYFPVVAYALGNGEPANPTVEDLVKTLSKNYRTGLFDLKTGTLNADTIKTLLIVKPSQTFTEKDKIKIDQYIMQGGNVIWFVDRLYAEFDSLLRSSADFVAFDKNLELDDIFFKYGVRINSNLLQSLTSASQPIVVPNSSGGQPQMQRLPFPYYPLLSSPNNLHPISRNLDHVLSIFPSSIDTVIARGIKKTILLASDTNSRTISSPNLVQLYSVKSDAELASFNKGNLPVAVLLEGKFSSLYTNRLTPQAKDTASLFTGVPFIANGIKDAKQIIVSDADLVTNVITQSQGSLPMGMQQFENYQFANKDFLLNCLDYMVGNTGIIETRNKDFTLRLLDKATVKEYKVLWQTINILLPLILVALLAIALQFIRNKKYAS